jgi:L-ascorbate metabolism protein UlaG (beta-lactamase superfamily)
MGARLTYIGHSTALVEQGGVRLLTDPLLRSVGHVRRRVPPPELEQLTGLDGILISHAHADHLDLGSLRRLRHRGPIIAPRGCARLLARAGATAIVEMEPGDRVGIGDVTIEAVEADHDGRRHPFARPTPALGYLITAPTRIYFAGDTDLFDDMAALAGRVDVALLPIDGWGPRLPAGHMKPASAARAVDLIRPRVAVPIHWGTMRSIGTRGARDVRAPALAFTAAVAELGLSTEVRIIPPGESMPLDGLRASPDRGDAAEGARA